MDMATVKYEPRKEVIIHETSTFETAQEFVEFLTQGLRGNFPPVHWVDGILLTFSALPYTDTVSKEIIQGRLHWDHLSFAPLPEYQSTITTSDNAASLTILNVSSNDTFRSVAKYIHEKLLK